MATRKPRVELLEGYNSLKDSYLTHYFSRADVLKHLIHMGLVTRKGKIVPEQEWRKLYAQQQREEKEKERETHRRRLLEAEEASKRRIRQKIRRREEAQLARRPSVSEPDLIQFDIEWSFRPVSGTTESPASNGNSGTSGTSNGSSDVVTGVHSGAGPSHGNEEGTSYDTSGSRGRNGGEQANIMGLLDSSPEFSPHGRKHRHPQKNRFVENHGVVGEPYIKSLGPNPSPRYIHILRPTNSCREVWLRLCPPQPISSRPPPPKPPTHFRLVYAGGGAPCHTPTDLTLQQQPAGAHNVTVFHGIVQIGDEIEFTSYRRENFPFSLTIYEDGVTTGRLSACCEYRYAAGSRLGGPSGHLRVLEIIGGEPCLKCQMRAVEKKHFSRHKNSYLRTRHSHKTTKTSVGKSQSPTPEESESESVEEGSISSKASTGRSSRGTQTPMGGIGISDSSDSSTDIESDRSKCFRLRKSRNKHVLQYDSDSCNGSSDLEVAAALGVPSCEPKKERKKHSLSRRSSTKYTHKRNLSNGGKGENSNTEPSQDTSNDDADQQKEPLHNKKLFHISSSMEGQLDDKVTGRNYQTTSSKDRGSRNSSGRSCKSTRSRSRQSNQDAFNKVDSFYSQQNFTSSASENQDASDNPAEHSYGSSFEEEDEHEKSKSENTSKTKEGASNVEAPRDEDMGAAEENLKSVTSEVEEEVLEEAKDRSVIETVDDTEVEVDSEILSNDTSRAETVKESDKSVGYSISEDAGEDSDIVGLSYSEEEIIEDESKNDGK